MYEPKHISIPLRKVLKKIRDRVNACRKANGLPLLPEERKPRLKNFNKGEE